MMVPVTSAQERPVFIAGTDAELFALHTLPATPANGMGVLISWGAGSYPTCGRNQIRARLARRLAALGYHVVRQDYQGVGESTGSMRTVSFRQPWSDDVVATCRWMESIGIDRIVVLGYCFGGRNVLSSTPHLPNLAGVILIGPPVADQDHVETKSRNASFGWHVKRAFSLKTVRNFVRPRKRRQYRLYVQTKLGEALKIAPTTLAKPANGTASHATRRFLDPLRGLAERGIPVLIAYGTSDPFWHDFQAARDAKFPEIADRFDIRTIEASVNLQTELALQEQVITLVEGWCAALSGRSSS